MQVFNSFQEMAVGTGALDAQSQMGVFDAKHPTFAETVKKLLAEQQAGADNTDKIVETVKTASLTPEQINEMMETIARTARRPELEEKIKAILPSGAYEEPKQSGGEFDTFG